MCVVFWMFAFRVHFDPFIVCVEGLDICAKSSCSFSSYQKTIAVLVCITFGTQSSPPPPFLGGGRMMRLWSLSLRGVIKLWANRSEVTG